MRLGTTGRIALTVGIVYTLHFSTNVVRETYLAMSLGERFTIRVDDYLGLHPDLFELPGRGTYINNNPGTSFLAALPYAIFRPAIDAALRLAPELTAPKPPISYDTRRPNDSRFLNEVRARGLDVKLGLAAMSMFLGVMVPLGVLSVVVVFTFLRARLQDERLATWFALLYGFGTPIFFRSAFLNQNAVITHCVTLAFCLMAWPGANPAPTAERHHLLGGGFLLGFALLTDYSGLPLIVAFGCWALWLGFRRGGIRGALQSGATYTVGALGPILVLLGYQWRAFGNPWLPAQAYMPATDLSLRGWNGLQWPTLESLTRNLFDPRYGLIAYCPMLLAAFAAPFLDARRAGFARSELVFAIGAFLGLYLFSSANQFALLQWNTGVRYLVPGGALLFFALVPVLLRLPRGLAWATVVATVVISWSVAMVRLSVPESLAHVLLAGVELPWLTVLRKTAGSYAPFLTQGANPLGLFILTGLTLWALWRGHRFPPPAL